MNQTKMSVFVVAMLAMLVLSSSLAVNGQDNTGSIGGLLMDAVPLVNSLQNAPSTQGGQGGAGPSPSPAQIATENFCRGPDGCY